MKIDAILKFPQKLSNYEYLILLIVGLGLTGCQIFDQSADEAMIRARYTFLYL